MGDRKNCTQIILSIFAPLFICTALALRITKVTGEIRIERSILELKEPELLVNDEAKNGR